jgi:type IV pilus assembly protein PilY1
VDANTFTYTLPSAPGNNTARVNAPNHLLINGDVACIAGPSEQEPNTTPPGYTSCTFPLYAPVTRLDADNFTYPMSAPESADATRFTVFGGRLISSVRSSGTQTATINLPNHGLPATPISCAVLVTGTPGQWYDANCQPATIKDANTIDIRTDNPISGSSTTSDTAFATTADNHSFSTGRVVTIFNSPVAGYNGTHTITALSSTEFSFPSTVSTAANNLLQQIRVGYKITSITHPTAGNATQQNTATVTTSTPHGFEAGQDLRIMGTGAFTGTAGSGYDNAVTLWRVQSVPTTTTFTIFNSTTGGGIRGVTPASQTPANGVAGYEIKSITPVLSATGQIHFFRDLGVNSITSSSAAQGTITAGRPIDGDNAARDLIVNWVRSTDNRDNEDRNNISTDVRASVHGDVLHSRPVTVNYGRFPADPTLPATDNDIYVFYGSNDGILRAVKGATASDESAIAPGDERWGFIPREFFGKFKRLREQSPMISNLKQKDYFFDGSIGVYQKDVTPLGGRAGTVGDDPGDKVHLYLSLRRGGDFIYALDVKDPASPKLLWRKGKGDPGWGEIGQTWSEPKVARLNWAFDPVNNPDSVVLIFGAGYDDAVEDINPCLLEEFNATNVVQKRVGSGTVTYLNAGSCSVINPTGTATTIARTRGRGILVVNAFTGDVLWQAGPAPAGAAHNLTHPEMTCAIASDVSVLDRNRDGRADRLYTGDTCGNVWRAEISDEDPRNWKVTKIAALSSGTNTEIGSKRKFLFPPDLVFAKDGTGPHLVVLLGSGDREHPFDTTIQNTFFMIKDRDATSSSGGAINSTTRSIAAASSGSSVAPVTTTDVFDATNVNGANQFGWKIDLRSGEKTVGSAVTISSTVFFNTNQPDASVGGGSCGSNLGIARQYLVSYVDAGATTDLNGLGTLSVANRSVVHKGGGYLPSPVPVVVEIDGKRYQAVISGTAVKSPPGLTLDARVRTYWYREIDQN